MKRTPIVFGTVLCAAVIVLLLLIRPSRRDQGPRDIGKVGMLLNGSIEDRSHAQAQYEALSAVCAERGLDLVCEDRVPADGTFRERAEALIGEGCGILFCDARLSGTDLPELEEAVEELPSSLGRSYQARYLAGIVAGSVGRGHQIGYVLSSFTPETIRQLNAFTIGARLADPEAVVHVRHTDDWNDGEKAASETATLLESWDIGVLAQHLGTVSPLRLAEERGVYTIGDGYDDADLFPGTWLTGCVSDWGPFFRERIEERVRGRDPGPRWWEGIRSGLVDLAPFSDLADQRTRDLVETERARLMDGTHDVFFGPLTDIYGVLQVREDENVSDEQLLNGMYWFVDGVAME